jgi:hypothetical protein
MSHFVFLILTILIIFQIVTSIWNYKSLTELKNKSFNQNQQLNDAKYFELKSKHEFTIATISIITTAVVFLGYNSIQGIQNDLKADYQKKVDSTDAKLTIAENKINAMAGGIDDKFKQVDTSMNGYKNLLRYFELQQENLNQEAGKVKTELTFAQEKINQINRKNILKQNMYIVENIQYNLEVIEDTLENNNWQIVYFKDLKTIMGDRLPEFKKRPFIISALSNEGSEVSIKNITTTSFEMASFSYIVPENSPEKRKKDLIQYYTIIISEIPD